MTAERSTLLFNRSSYEDKVVMDDYIAAVANAHRLHSEQNIIATNLVHADAPNGEYHIKTGGLLGDQAYYGLKANGGFFNNKAKHGLPNILGVIYLSDATTAYPLAIFDSSLISKKRTAAATAVAARYLKPEGNMRLGIVGYGSQTEAHIEALARVGQIDAITIAGRDEQKAETFAAMISQNTGYRVEVDSIQNVCEQNNVVVTCTPSTVPFVQSEWIKPGTFVAAIGADSPGKNEFEPAFMKRAKIVADIKSQVVKVGESQHAITNGLIGEHEIYGELGDLITGKIKGRQSADEIFVYDSTGTAIQDIAVAAFIYEKLRDSKQIQRINFFE